MEKGKESSHAQEMKKKSAETHRVVSKLAISFAIVSFADETRWYLWNYHVWTIGY